VCIYIYIYIYKLTYIYWWDWGLTQGFELAKQALHFLNHISSPFYSDYFGDGVLSTICPSWPQTEILPISVSHVSRLIDVSNQHLVYIYVLMEKIIVLSLYLLDLYDFAFMVSLLFS
jgi:hypothetical protein